MHHFATPRTAWCPANNLAEWTRIDGGRPIAGKVRIGNIARYARQSSINNFVTILFGIPLAWLCPDEAHIKRGDHAMAKAAKKSRLQRRRKGSKESCGEEGRGEESRSEKAASKKGRRQKDQARDAQH